MIISIDVDKACDKIQHSFMIKTINKLGREGTHLNITKAIYDKTTANIISGERVKSLSIRAGTRQGRPHRP